MDKVLINNPLQTDRQTDRRYINIARGTAVFLMLWGHCVQFCCAGSFDFFENSVFRVIYSFHMPLFMLISGYLFFFTFQKRNLRDLLIHRTQSLLQPIIMCGILNFLLTDALFGLLRGSFICITIHKLHFRKNENQQGSIWKIALY